MKHGSQSLRAGKPLLLPSGMALLVIERTRLSVFGGGAWRGVIAQCEPHALLVLGAEGGLSVLAAGSGPISLTALSDALPSWEQVLSELASATQR